MFLPGHVFKMVEPAVGGRSARRRGTFGRRILGGAPLRRDEHHLNHPPVILRIHSEQAEDARAYVEW